MREMDPGHFYILDKLATNVDGDESMDVELFFVKRIGDKFPGNEPPGYDGTTTQEVLRALIARTKYVDGQIHSDMNDDVISHLRNAMFLLEERAAQTHGRSILNSVDRMDIENEPTCERCGHILCEEHPADDGTSFMATGEL